MEAELKSLDSADAPDSAVRLFRPNDLGECNVPASRTNTGISPTRIGT